MELAYINRPVVRQWPTGHLGLDRAASASSTITWWSWRPCLFCFVSWYRNKWTGCLVFPKSRAWKWNKTQYRPLKHRGPTDTCLLLRAVFVFILWGQCRAACDRWLHIPKANCVMNRMAAGTRQASVEYSYCCSDLYQVSFFAFLSTEQCFMVCVSDLSIPW
jgi:hypothetical protein